MAIQHRRGIYSRFDPTRLVAGEWAIVLSGDPSATDGMAAYVCFASGTVKRVATFEDMVAAIAEATDEVVETVRDNLTEALNAATARANAAAQRAEDGEDTRVTAESGRVDAESGRVSAETSRVSAEQGRADAEAVRDSAEQGRVSAEQSRVTAESTRISNEQGRVAAETARTENERGRTGAEQTRESSEATRVSNEQARVAAEQGRVTAEQGRVAAEQARAASQSDNNSRQEQNDLAQGRNDEQQEYNNQMAVRHAYHECGAGEYDTGTLEPNITEPQEGVMYLVPTGDATNPYVHWLWMNGDWSPAGADAGWLAEISTSDIDAIVNDSATTPEGNEVLTLTRLTYLWTKLKAKFAALAHTHSISDITSGTLGTARGGTGITSNPSMLTNLGSTGSASVFQSSPRPGVTGTLAVANGGTGGATPELARTSLGVPSTTELASIESSIADVESTTATANHAVGDYFMLGNVLMRATAAIATGEQITTSNATPATIQSQIDTLQDSLSVIRLELSFTSGATYWYNSRITNETTVFPVHVYQSEHAPGMSFDVQHNGTGRKIFYVRNADGTIPANGTIVINALVFW